MVEKIRAWAEVKDGYLVCAYCKNPMQAQDAQSLRDLAAMTRVEANCTRCGIGYEWDSAEQRWVEIIQVSGGSLEYHIGEAAKMEHRLKAIMSRAIDSSKPYLLAHGAFLISRDSWVEMFKEACPEFNKMDALFKKSDAGEKIEKAEVDEALRSLKFASAPETPDEEPKGLDADLVMIMRHQSQGMFHPYTCRGCHAAGNHREAVMVPNVDPEGKYILLVCPYMDCHCEQFLTEKDLEMIRKVAHFLRRKGG